MKRLGDLANKNILAKSQTESPIEVILFNEILSSGKFVLCSKGDRPTGEGFFVFPQQRMGDYRADFLIKSNRYIPRKRVWPPQLSRTLCVECDGHEFHSAPEDLEYDRIRDDYFASLGILTLRLGGSLIHRQPSFCVDMIIEKLTSAGA